MNHEIQPVEKHRVDAELVSMDMAPPSAGDGPPPLSVAAILRRRWRMILLLWILMSGISIPFIWARKQPAYTAKAYVEVVPTRPTIDPSERDQAMPMFEGFLSTQQHLVASQRVLTAALSNPNVRNLSIMAAENPAQILSRVLSVERVQRSFLLEISVTQEDPEAALRLTQAVLDAYMAQVVGAQIAEDREKLEFWQSRQAQLRNAINQKREEVRKLAEEYGTTSASTFDLLRQAFETYTSATKQQLQEQELALLELHEQLRLLEKGTVLGIIPEEGLTYQDRERAITNDPLVSALRDRLVGVSEHLVRIQSALTEAHTEVVRTRQERDRLREQLEQERTRAAADFEKEIAAKQQQLVEFTKARLARQIEATQRHQQNLAKRAEEEDKKARRIGLIAAEIEELRNETEMMQREFEDVAAKIRRVEQDQERPAHVIKASDAVADEMADKRTKWAAAALFGSLLFALGVAGVRDHIDTHLYNAEDVETDAGLPVLGLVPSLKDLQAGRIEQEDFVESYRLIRARLSAFGPDGHPPKSLLVTSPLPGEGKTSLAINLAACLAVQGRRVLLVDADMRAPDIGRLLGLQPGHYLQEVLAGEQPVEHSVVPSRLAGVDVLAADTNGQFASQMLDSRSASRLLHAAAHYDHIVIDSPPALLVADAMVWARVVSGVIISSLAQRSEKQTILMSCKRLKSVGASLLGSVVGNIARHERFYGYSSRYAYTAARQKAGENAQLTVLQFDENGPSSPKTPES